MDKNYVNDEVPLLEVLEGKKFKGSEETIL